MNTPRQYSYVGPHAVRQLLQQPSQRTCVRHSDDILDWIKATKPSVQPDKTIVATFIIDTSQALWIADRHSEHVVCAAGQDVLSAGEITFDIQGNQIEVVEVTNQSTGYCPEPESWWAVESALAQIGLPHPSAFTTEFIFRQCRACGTTNIVKDMWFECAVCQAELSQRWNYSEHSS
jgi:hypothetical protein